MKKAVILFFLICWSSISFAIKIPKKLEVPANIIAEMQQIEQFDFGKEYSTFLYSKEFAEIYNDVLEVNDGESHFLDLKEVSKLAPDVLAIGLSITETQPKTERLFPEYLCSFKLFVTARDDYWLPDGKYGDYYEYEHRNKPKHNNVEIIMGNGFDSDFFMRSFIANTELDDREDGYGGGSFNLTRFERPSVSEGIIYWQYDFRCSHMPKITQRRSIWLEKKGGFNYKHTHYNPPYQKDFYHFPIPPEIIRRACPYSQKAVLTDEWNLLIEGDFQAEMFKPVDEIYNCKK